MRSVAVGIDLATAGARAHALDVVSGAVLARVSAALPAPVVEGPSRRQGPRYAEVAAGLLEELAARLGARAGDVGAISVTGTSGTVVPVDSRGRPVGAAVLYNDGTTADAERALAADGIRRPAGMLARIAAVLGAAPAGVGAASTADVVAAALVGASVPMDTSHALKAAIDPAAGRWDDAALQAAGVDAARLPALVAPGAVLGEVGIGPFAGALVVAGMTDGCTSQIATGAVGVGDSVGVLGTTLVLKAGAAHEVLDTARGIYSHLAPDGVWLPGGASNVGAASLAAIVPAAAGRETEFDRDAVELRGGAAAYPLPFRGERFPWRDATATAVIVGRGWDDLTPVEAYRVVLEGVALVERWALEELAGVGVGSHRHVLSGGASASALWNGIRASALGRSVQVAATRDSGFGAAVLAASVLRGEPLSAVAAQLAGPGTQVDPDPVLARELDRRYAELRAATG